MEQFIESMINQFGYLAITLLIAVENIFPPIPSELILTFSGFLTTQSQLNVAGSIIAATLGASIGAAILYWIGSFLDMPTLAKLVDSRLGRALHLRLKDFERAEAFFLRHGRFAVFAGRFIPVVRSLISVPAGMTKMSFPVFMMYSSLGAGIWNTVLIGLGHYAGQAWQQVLTVIDEYKYVVVLGGVICGLLIWLAYRMYTKKAKSV
ncbi:membrane protein DedA with SNARE-associated domain [Weissella uvarum]|uniref:DedA family protein n=1 Tax=Weissella uvarum TaxID=1479233 RepID=UPI0019608E94|nr:DedA family protein [Weissella uvarum]MBM7617698.1 membrane protein DedA with SNARE-associated domain [Weissella uvarum]MCM0596047.1 DedA family protein [Weissella uvarum]